MGKIKLFPTQILSRPSTWRPGAVAGLGEPLNHHLLRGKEIEKIELHNRKLYRSPSGIGTSREPSWALWEISPSWDGKRRLRGQVVDHFFSPRQVVDHFFALRQGQLGRLRLVFAARGPASRPWRRLRLLHRFFKRYIFLKDLRGIRRDPKTARRTRTSPAVGRLGLPGLSAGSAGVSG